MCLKLYFVVYFESVFVIVFEHFVFVIGRCIDLIVPDIPEELQIKIKREQYLAKQILSGTADDTNFQGSTTATSDYE